jgi:hypothetical protein
VKAHELFRLLSGSEVAALVLAACEVEEIPERIAGGVITYQQIPLRRFSRLPEETRRAYVRRTLRDKRASDLALYVLSAALTKGKARMIEAFLGESGLPHEGPSLSFEGEIPEPPKAKMNAAVDVVLAGFPPRDVALYLRAFAAQPDVHWASLEERLTSDARLALEDRSAE